MICDYKDLEKFSKCVFERLGFSEEHSEIVAKSLILANLRGVDSHGVIRIPHYVEGLEQGKISSKPNIRILKENMFFSLIDGGESLGYIPATLATNLAVSKAKECGIGLVGVVNLKHVGMLANYILKIVDNKLFGLAIANASPSMGLHEFKKPVVGTNPLAIGFPANDSPPIILDMATSVVAKGKLLIAARKGIEIPKGWALNQKGEDTTDPKEAINGILLPIGEHKGFSLALIIDIICGIIMGGGYGLKVKKTWFSQGGFLVFASRIDLARSYDEYIRELKEYIKEIKAIPTLEGKRVLLPNDIEEENMKKRINDGIPIEDEVFDELCKLARKYNIEPPKFRYY
jgi:LDH2 family malate/lactate/ureidoglycolate dehydrogenase